MESRTTCVVKYMGHKIAKDIWDILKGLVPWFLGGICILIAGVISYLGVVTYGWSLALNGWLWLITIVYLAVTIIDDAEFGNVAGAGCVLALLTTFVWVLIGLGVDSHGNLNPEYLMTFPWIQVAVLVLWCIPWSLTQYLKIVYKAAIAYCDKLIAEANNGQTKH